MKKFSEIAFVGQLGIMIGISALIVVAGEFLVLNSKSAENKELETKVATIEAELVKLRPLKTKLTQLKADNELLERQLADNLRFLPEEKEADTFIKMVQEASVQAGVNVRRFTAKPTTQKEFHIEMPFEINIDGNYYSVLQFFDRLSKLSRIVNVSNLAIGPTAGGARGVSRRYAYTPNETVLASCITTTFFSREQTAAKK